MPVAAIINSHYGTGLPLVIDVEPATTPHTISYASLPSILFVSRVEYAALLA